ncbi:MAG: hypothetical protein AB4426_14590 [Xenococcaceae cyanobacterium]
MQYYYHPILQQILPKPRLLPVTSEDIGGYIEQLGLSETEARELARIQNKDPDERTLTEWRYLFGFDLGCS